MKQYVVDQLRIEDYERLRDYLDKSYPSASLPGIYCMPVDPSVLDADQRSHRDCHPLIFSLELEPDSLHCELLVRTSQRMRCSCMRYATEAQRNWIIGLIDSILEQLDIRV